MAYRIVGAPLPRHDALGKVTGATRYPADLIQPSMLQLQVIFSHRVHARILAIDTSAALQYPGVVTVLTAQDVPYNAYGLIENDQPVLCKDKVRFEGDKVALVIAESKEAAIAGAKLVVVTYEDLPAVTDARVAFVKGASLVHEQLGTNRRYHIPLRKGDVAQALAEADIVLEDTFSTSWQEHAFLQPEAGIAYIDEQGRVVVETAGQWLHEDRRQIAAILKLPEECVVVRYAAIGGAFGGREDLSIQHLLALASWKLQQPTALVWTREESMIAHHKRHPISITARWGAKKDGTVTAVEAEVLADGGAYASTSIEVLKAATLFVSGCYEIPNIAVDGYAVYTNNIPSGAFRGFGAPQTQFAGEIMITRLAQELGIDPIDIRRRNIYREGSIEPTHQPLPPGVSALEVLERCVEEARTRWGYGEEQPSLAGHLRRGIGIACGIKNVGYSYGYPEQATATVEIYGVAEMERAVIRAGIADVGQGTHLIMRQIAAETLALPLEKVTIISNDSSETPNSGSVSASRMTYVGGRAVQNAAAAAKEKWSYSDDEYVEATVQFRPTPTTPLDLETFSARPNYCYGYSAQAIEVEVNMLTGQVQVLRIISVHDVGKAINIQQVTGQIEGCLAQALGYALMENFQIRNGHVLTSDFNTYLLPTVLDMPTDVTPVVLELADPDGPFGARGMAEMPLIPFAPAVASAIHKATGVWLKQLPMTPERVLGAIRLSK